jgi:hypothetical protein
MPNLALTWHETANSTGTPETALPLAAAGRSATEGKQATTEECTNVEKPLTAEMTETARPLLIAVATERQPATEDKMDYSVLLLALSSLLVSDNYYPYGLLSAVKSSE